MNIFNTYISCEKNLSNNKIHIIDPDKHLQYVKENLSSWIQESKDKTHVIIDTLSDLEKHSNNHLQDK